jgi:hypothetical protein
MSDGGIGGGKYRRDGNVGALSGDFNDHDDKLR